MPQKRKKEGNSRKSLMHTNRVWEDKAIKEAAGFCFVSCFVGGGLQGDKATCSWTTRLPLIPERTRKSFTVLCQLFHLFMCIKAVGRRQQGRRPACCHMLGASLEAPSPLCPPSAWIVYQSSFWGNHLGQRALYSHIYSGRDGTWLRIRSDSTQSGRRSTETLPTFMSTRPPPLLLLLLVLLLFLTPALMRLCFSLL